MRDHKPLKAQQGYALTEVLIAGVIAASVLTVMATAISTCTRAIRDTQHVENHIYEATQISHQMRAGLGVDTILHDFSGWNWKVSTRQQTGIFSSDSAILATYQFTRNFNTDRAFAFSISRLEGGQE